MFDEWEFPLKLPSCHQSSTHAYLQRQMLQLVAPLTVPGSRDPYDTVKGASRINLQPLRSLRVFLDIYSIPGEHFIKVRLCSGWSSWQWWPLHYRADDICGPLKFTAGYFIFCLSNTPRPTQPLKHARLPSHSSARRLRA